jgi:hypothetical protein
MRPRIPLLDRLPALLRVKSLDDLSQLDCWWWYGALHRWQPVVRLDGKQASARRAIYEAMIGPLDPSSRLRSQCRTPCCVNPWHMAVGGLPAFTTNVDIAPVEDAPLTPDDVFDILVTLPSRDPDLLAKQLDLPRDLVVAALELF